MPSLKSKELMDCLSLKIIHCNYICIVFMLLQEYEFYVASMVFLKMMLSVDKSP